MQLKLFYGLTSLAALLSTVTCAPAGLAGPGVPGLGAQSVAPLPSVDEVKKHLNLAKDTSLFYSGPGSYGRKAKAWAKGKSNGYKILGELWKDSSYPDQWQNDAAASLDFFNIASQAMAEASSGTAYVMLPSDTKGTEWKKETVWDKYEWPNLGSGITKVVRVNPDNDDQETIKGADASAAYAPGWCGVHVTQYQKNEGPAGTPSGGTSNYRLDVKLYDANKNEIGRIDAADAAPPNGVGVSSKLPLVFVVTPGNVDNDPVTFNYGTQSWAYADAAHPCNFGRFNNGKREGDCGFSC